MGKYYTSEYRDDLVNFIVDGTIPGALKGDTENKRLIMGYGIQILELKRQQVDERIGRWQKVVDEWAEKTRQQMLEYQVQQSKQ